MGQPVTGRTVPEAMSPGSLAPGAGRLHVEAGMLDASPAGAAGAVFRVKPGNQVPRTVGRGPIGETGWPGPGAAERSGPPAALAAADQQGTGREVYVPPFQGHGLSDPQAGPPHDERRHPSAAMPQGREGVQEPLDLLGVPVVEGIVTWELLRQKFPFGQAEPILRPTARNLQPAPWRLTGRPEMGTFRLKVPSSHPPRALREIQPDGAGHPLSEVYGLQPARSGDGYALSLTVSV